MQVSTPLLNFIKVYKNAIAKKIADRVILTDAKLNWKLHEWTGYYGTSASPQPDKEFQRADLTGFEKVALTECIDKCINDYIHGKNFSLHGRSPIVINKYVKGQSLMTHIDHKTNYFEGKNKGIPILTAIGALNDNYIGGELTLCNDYKVPLSQGDIVVFPSNFLFPHSINEIQEGTRYSFNQWFW